MQKIIVFLNGRYSPFNSFLCVSACGLTTPFIKNHKTSPDTWLYAVDGGLGKILENKIKFHRVHFFGDCDSLSKKYLKKLFSEKNISNTILPIEKNLSDFAVLLDHISENLKKSDQESYFIEIYGGLGGSGDHEYINIEEVKKFMKYQTKAGLVVFQNKFIFSTVSFQIEKSAKNIFSVLAECAFSLQNSLYEGNIQLHRPSHGLSNKITSYPLLLKKENNLEAVTFILR